MLAVLKRPVSGKVWKENVESTDWMRTPAKDARVIIHAFVNSGERCYELGIAPAGIERAATVGSTRPSQLFLNTERTGELTRIEENKIAKTVSY